MMIHSDSKNLRPCILGVCLVVLFASFRETYSDIPRFWKKSADVKRFGSSIVLPLSGNVYPLGYYSTSLNIGRPPKLYDFDIDTGSDLTWVQCDAPCTGCTKPRHLLYKPNSNNLVSCDDPVCTAVQTQGDQPCKSPDDQCDYEVSYADSGSSLGVLINDYFPLQLSNGSTFGPRLMFGCGYNQHYSGHVPPPPTVGVLGLGSGKVSIITQLHGMGMIRNVLGHCLSSRDGGYLFFGDDVVPSQVSWTPMATTSVDKNYASGPAELLYNAKSTGIKGLQVLFDSGSSYTYFISKAYKAVLDLIKGDLKRKPLKDAAEDNSLPVCWKGAKPFKSVDEVKNYFRPMALNFKNAKSTQLQLPPESYLIISKHGNACLGILNGSEVNLGDLNILGDISMLDKLIIYDNEKKQIGWAPANCDRLLKS